jgi:hypothetical protein
LGSKLIPTGEHAIGGGANYSAIFVENIAYAPLNFSFGNGNLMNKSKSIIISTAIFFIIIIGCYLTYYQYWVLEEVVVLIAMWGAGYIEAILLILYGSHLIRKIRENEEFRTVAAWRYLCVLFLSIFLIPYSIINLSLRFGNMLGLSIYFGLGVHVMILIVLIVATVAFFTYAIMA